MTGKTKILIVEDDPNLCELISLYLAKENFETREVHSGGKALDEFTKFSPHLVILDLMLPEMDGYQVCREIRKTGEIPIIMLTARGDTFDKVLGLELGADDYITKPFSIREVQARVKANIRRTASLLEDLKPVERGEGLYVDNERFDVFVNGKSAELTQREYELVKFLAGQPGKVFSREELLQCVWQYDYFGDLRAVDVAVRRLREKIEKDSSQPRYIITKRGVGYYFEP